MKDLKLIVSEVEGVLTTGRQPIDELGNVPFKEYYTPDFEVINTIKSEICPVVFISTDSAINYNLFRRKNIPFFWAKKDKVPILSEVLRRYSVTPEEVLYIGSKFSDIPCMNMVPTSVSTHKLSTYMNEDGRYTSLTTLPGHGVFVEIYLRIKNGDV